MKNRLWSALAVTASLFATQEAQAGTPGPELYIDSQDPICVKWQIGDPPPASAFRTIWNGGDFMSLLPYDILPTEKEAWLMASPDAGMLENDGGIEEGEGKGEESSQLIEIMFMPEGLAPGSHKATLRFRNIYEPEDSKEVAVILQVDMPDADLRLDDTTTIDETYHIGGTPPASITRTVMNDGPSGSELVWTVHGLEPWLCVHPLDGILGPEGAEAVEIKFDEAGLPEGTYETTLHFQNIADASDYADLDVRLTVIQPKADLLLDDTTMITATHSIGSAGPAAQTRTVENGGGLLSNLGWAVYPLQPTPWIAFDPTAGTVGQGATDPVAVSFLVDGLAAGSYATTIRFENVLDATDFEDVGVLLQVNMPPADLTIDSTSKITAFYTIGGDAPAKAQRAITNSGPVGSELAWSLSEVNGVTWLFTDPNQNGVLGAQDSQAFEIGFAPAAIDPGTYNTVLRFQNDMDGTDFEEVEVELQVVLPMADLCVDSAAPIQVDYQIADPLPAPIVRTVTNCGDFLSKLGWALSTVPNATWLQTDVTSGSLPQNESEAVTFTLDPTGLEEGVYSATVRFQNVFEAGDFEEFSVTLTVNRPAADLCLDTSAGVSDEYIIGFDIPAEIVRTVQNCGPDGSILSWSVTQDPPAPWLLMLGATAGVLEHAETQIVRAKYALEGLAPGVYETTLRFENAADGSDNEEVQVQLTVTDPVPDLCIGDELEELVVGYTVGDVLPADFPVSIENCGHPKGSLHWSVTPSVPVPWLVIDPMSGVIGPDELTMQSLLKFDPTGMPDGTYETTLRFENLADELDFVEIPITLEIGNMVFVPGDRLMGSVLDFDKSHEVEFDAVKGMNLRLHVRAPDKDVDLQFVVLDSQGAVVDSAKVKAKATKKGAKVVFKLKATDRYRLRIEPHKGAHGSFIVDTGRKLPKKAKKVKVSGGAGLNGYLTGKALTLPGARVDLKAKPTNFTGPLGLAVMSPEGGMFDSSAFTQSTESGGVRVDDMPAVTLGEWQFLIDGFVKKNNEAKMKITLEQPMKGTATLMLP